MAQRRIACVNCSTDDNELLVTVHGNRGLQYISQEHNIVLCRNCGLGFLNPQHEEQDYSRYYATADYKPITISAKAALRNQEYRKVQAAFLTDTLDRLLQDWRQRNLEAMDIGCGMGVLLYFLREAGLRGRGVESSPHAATFARDRLGLDVVEGSVYDLATEPQCDIVINTASIEHFTDPLTALKSMRAPLKSGGILYVNTQDLLGMVLKKGLGHWFKFVHTYYYTEQTLVSLIEQAGFEVVRSFTMPPILKSSIVYPGNYCSGELNIIAIKRESISRPTPRQDSIERIRTAFANAKQRDQLHMYANEFVRKPPASLALKVARRVMKPKALFDQYFLANGAVDTTRFPPLLTTIRSPA